MACYQGTYFTQQFTVTDSNRNPIDISGWTFEADFRDRVDTPELLNLTSAGGGFTIIDAANGRFEMSITAAQTEEFPTGKLVFDVLRTDSTPGPVFLFGGKLTVRQPVTR